MIRSLIIACLLIGLTAQARAERIAGALSTTEVSITSSFTGEKLTLFGNVEPDSGADNSQIEGPYHVIILISGPSIDRVARRKTHEFGIWLNTEQITFRNYPSFARILSSAPINEIAELDILESIGILDRTSQPPVTLEGNGDAELFANELQRLMNERGLFAAEPRAVEFRSNTLYSAQIDLPASVPNGTFLAETYLFSNGELLAKRSEGFRVRKTGFERLLGDAAQHYSLLYGLACVLLAIFTGWLGGVIFRR